MCLMRMGSIHRRYGLRMGIKAFRMPDVDALTPEVGVLRPGQMCLSGGKVHDGKIIFVCNTHREFGRYYLPGVKNIKRGRFDRSRGYKT